MGGLCSPPPQRVRPIKPEDEAAGAGARAGAGKAKASQPAALPAHCTNRAACRDAPALRRARECGRKV